LQRGPAKSGTWDADAFYATGADGWATFSREWSQYGPISGTCVEIGCGAGRITKQLVTAFDAVYAVDVSDRMLELTHEAAPEAVTVLTDGARIPLDDASADAVFSCHVLQHLENGDAVAEAIADIRRLLRPNGTAMLHLLIREDSPGLPQRLGSEARLRVTRWRNSNRGSYSRVRRYYPSEMRAMFLAAGFRDVE